MKILLTRAALVLLPALVACDSDSITRPDPVDQIPADAVLAWNQLAHDAAVAHDGYANPLDAARTLALLHIAQHDAINATDPVYETYAFHDTDTLAHPAAAAAAAAHAVLTALLPEQRAPFDARLEQDLAAVTDSTARVRGVALGSLAAAAILARRSADGSDTPIVGDYTPGTEPGRYQFTPPFPLAFAPGWRYVEPFSLAAADQFRPEPPPALGSAAYAAALNEVKEIGSASSSTRNAAQSASAKFWYEFSEIGWNRVARVVSEDRALGLRSAGRLFALLNMAIVDAYIAGWDAKYEYDLWRPFTAIRAADTDDNPATTADPVWEAAEPTPPVPDYPSTHSALGNAAAAVLAAVFGDDTSFSFTSSSADPDAATRTFSSFSAAADENAESRVLGGLHFRFACDAGQQLGRSIGEWTVANHLRAR